MIAVTAERSGGKHIGDVVGGKSDWSIYGGKSSSFQLNIYTSIFLEKIRNK